MGVILIAYERESEQVALEQMLVGRGHQVLRSQNGLAALDAARRDPPHLVVCDIVLPRMDGFALCRKWKQDERLQSIPFVFYTRRHDDPKYERFALELGAERFLSRNDKPESLIAAVDELLAGIPATPANVPLATVAPADEALARRAQAHALALAQKAEQAHVQAVTQLKAEQTQALERLQLSHQQTLERAQQLHTRLRGQIEELEAGQQRIAAGEARFRRVFEANPLPMWMADHATRGFIAVNDAALALYGYSRAEFLALTTRSLEGVAHEALDGEGANVAAHRNKSGDVLLVALASHEIEFDGRNADLVCAYNLTQRIVRDRTQVREAATSRALIDALGDGYLALDTEQRIVDTNAAYCRMSGYAREQLMNMTLADLESASIGETTVRLQLATVDGVSRQETRHKRADGTLLDVEVSSGQVASTGDGRTALLVRDVTQRCRELALQRHGQRQLEFLVELFKQADAVDESAIVRRVIEHAADATGSPLAYFFFVDPPSKTLTLAAWRDGSQARVTMASAEARPLAKTGLFTECVKARHPTSSNDLSWKPQTDGLPDLQRYIAVPMIADDQTVAILGVANRDAGYGDADQQMLVAMAEGVWRVVQAKRSHAQTLSALQRTDVALQGMIDSLVRMGERHDPHTAGSARRVAALAVALAREAGLDGERQHALRVAALLHDVGNVVVPAAILSKPGGLTAQETALMRTHVEEGCKLLADIDFGVPVAEIVFEHHERFDGSGYPRALQGEDIRIEARILAIADVVEAMCSRRPYREALGMDAAIDEINKHAGKLYDLHLVTACTRLVRQRGYALPD